jgi:D-alanyl-D-alanine carboxypeptidase (penicillin-binding protein 5/6)
MNEKVLAIGAEDTKYINATGLPGPGQYTTALDLSKILGYALQIPKLKEIIGTTEAKIATKKGKVFYLRSTDRLLWSDDKIIGGKTGYTRKAGHCFVCAAQGETKTILVAILGSPSRKKLWAETESLVSRNLQGGAPKTVPLEPIYLRRLLYEDSSFFTSFSPAESPPCMCLSAPHLDHGLDEHLNRCPGS